VNNNTLRDAHKTQKQRFGAAILRFSVTFASLHSQKTRRVCGLRTVTVNLLSSAITSKNVRHLFNLIIDIDNKPELIIKIHYIPDNQSAQSIPRHQAGYGDKASGILKPNKMFQLVF
jgi:hypothetical protein